MERLRIVLPTQSLSPLPFQLLGPSVETPESSEEQSRGLLRGAMGHLTRRPPRCRPGSTLAEPGNPLPHA